MSSSRQPQPRYMHAAVGVEKKLYIWEGNVGSLKIQKSTVEVFDVNSETWEEPKKLEGPLPHGLQGVAATSDGECAYSFGGFADSDDCFLNKVYKFELSQQVRCIEVQPKNTSCAPKKKSGCGVVYFNQKLVIYGGWTGPVETDELNTFDLETGVWSVQETAGEKPPPLAGHTFTKIDDHRAVLFGGIPVKTKLCGTYVLDMENWVWTKLVVSGAQPRSRKHHAACCITGPDKQHSLLTVVGGMRDDLRIVGDVWLLDVDKGVWHEVTLPAMITPRHGHSAVAFYIGTSFKVVVLFGGKQPSRLSDRDGSHISDTTLLLLEHRTNGEGFSWEVVRVVRADLQEQIKELEQSLGEEKDARRESDRALESLEQKCREEQEKRMQTEKIVERLEKRVTDLEQLIKDLTPQPKVAVQEATHGGLQATSSGAAVENIPRLQTDSLTQGNPFTCSLCLEDLQCVLEAVVNVNKKWERLGLALGLKKPTLNRIKSKHGNEVDDCMDEMLSMWLEKNDGCSPSWKGLVDALHKTTVGHGQEGDAIVRNMKSEYPNIAIEER